MRGDGKWTSHAPSGRERRPSSRPRARSRTGITWRTAPCIPTRRAAPASPAVAPSIARERGLARRHSAARLAAELPLVLVVVRVADALTALSGAGTGLVLRVLLGQRLAELAVQLVVSRRLTGFLGHPVSFTRP